MIGGGRIQHVQRNKAARCRPAHALYFSTYEAMKITLGVERSMHAPLATAASGAVATVVNDAIMTPGDVIKQRLQIASSPYTGVWDCMRRTYQAEGLRAFFRSYKTTVRSLTHNTASLGRPLAV